MMNVLVKHIVALLLLSMAFSSCTVELTPPLRVEEEITSSLYYRATVGEGVSTRASINDSRQYVFELGDELYVTHEESGDVKMFGFLSLVAGEGATTGTFEGELMCLNGYTPKSTDVLLGRLVGKKDLLYDRKNGRLFGKGSTTDTNPVYPSNQYADSFEDALRKFSDFRGESTYGAHSFTLGQQSAFLVFSVSFEDMVSPPASATATINVTKADESSLVLSASVPVDNSMGFPLVSFVAPFAGGMNLKSASFTISGLGADFTDSIDNDNNASTSFTLAQNRYYSINRTTINDQFFTIRATESGAHIKFNFGSSHQLQYGTNGNWTAANTGDIIVLGPKEFIQVRAIANNYTASTGLFTLGDGESCFIYGDIMSLLCSSEYVRKTTINNSAFKNLFKGINVDIPSGRPLKLGGDIYGTNDYRVTGLGTNCFESMFQGCVTLTRPPEFPNVGVIPTSACLNMFLGCTSLQSAPDLPASTVGDYGYKNMFNGCRALSSVPESIAGASGTVGVSGCESMFRGCVSLTTPPVLPSPTVGNNGYLNMFYGCTSLISSPALEAETIGTGVYYSMFRGCTALVSAPSVLPAVTLKENCYREMFYGCSSLTSVPDLPATNADDAANVYYQMFYGCISLNLSTKTDWNLGLVKTGASGCREMFYGCQSLVNCPGLPYLTDVGAYGCYQMFRGCKELSFVPSELKADQVGEHGYRGMFYSCERITTTPDIKATVMQANACKEMFRGCTRLATITGDLKPTVAMESMYSYMFFGCSSLTSPPSLPATTLGKECYRSMFYNCSSLTSAPALPATKLVEQCYQEMFYNCKSLIGPVYLPATKLVKDCYDGMFNGASKLDEVICLATSREEWSEDGGSGSNRLVPSCNDWLRNVKATGNFYFAYGYGGIWKRDDNSGIPTGWNGQPYQQLIPLFPDTNPFDPEEDL